MSLRGGERVGSAEVLRLSGGGRSRPGSNRGNKEADSVEGRSSKSRSNTSASRGNVSQQASNRDGGDGGGVGVGGQAAPERSSRRSERSTAGTNLERDADGRSTDGRSSGLSMSRKLVSGGRGSIPTGRSREEAQVQQESKSSGAKTPALAEEDKDLIHKRLREKYGFGISDKELRCISRMQAKGQGISYDKGGKLVVPENARGPLFSKAMVIGKETSAVKGQVVRHIDRGKHTAGECDRDYLSGGLKGVIMDVCGDYAQVRWSNGNVRFYYVGSSPYRPESQNPRAIRCLVLVSS